MSRTDTWMPLYIADYLVDTMRLSTVQHGAYLLLLMEYWRQGPLVDDDNELASVAKLDRKTWDRDVGPAVRRFFHKQDDGLLHQKRIDTERDKAVELSRKRREAAMQRTDRVKDKEPTDGGANEMQLQEQMHSNSSSNCTPVAAVLQPSLSRDLSPFTERKKEPVATLPRVTDASESAVSAWNEMASQHGLSSVRHMTDKRKSHLRQRLQECGGIEGWRDALRFVTDSPFLLGDNRNGWKADFDFLLQPSSFTKLMEGSYGNRGNAKRSAAEVMGVGPSSDWENMIDGTELPV